MTAKKAFASALSTDPDWLKAVRAAAVQVAQDLGGSCDLAFLFATELYPGLKPEALPELIAEALSFRVLIGCNASGIIAGEREIEMEPAVSLLGMRLPGVKTTPFHLSSQEAGSFQSPQEILSLLDLYPVDQPKFIALADPMSCDIEKSVRLFNEAYPGAPVIGGLASGAAIGRPNWLLLGKEVYPEGLVGVALSGPVEFEVVVAQGCRPIGSPAIITRAEGNILRELGGKPPLQVLRELISGLAAEDKELARHSLFAGLVMDEYRSKFQRGDFLIRNLLGYDQTSGALAIGANLRVGQTLQFQLRDAKTSAEDLKDLLERLELPGDGARGALLVSCCGRGRGLYRRPGHDSKMIQSLKGPLPLAGFFANGEIGPVCGRNYVHGYTSSLAVIK